MKTIFNAIKAAFELAENKALFTGAGLIAPERTIIYNREYEDEENDHVPPRPYVSVEFGQVDWEHMDGKKEGDVPVRLHLVQDVISFVEKQDDLLEYGDIVIQILDGLLISGDVLEHKGSDPDQDSRHYFVNKENFVIRATR